MSIWVRAFLTKPISQLEASVLNQGICERLKLLTYLFCPEDEEDPDEVIRRLRIDEDRVDRFRMIYKIDTDSFIPVEHWVGLRAEGEIAEELKALKDDRRKEANHIRTVLSAAVETVGFELKNSDALGMGWPLAIAAAATLIQSSDGLIKADQSGWMVPDGNEVSIILREDLS